MTDRLVIFDFDGTLTKSDTLFAFACFAIGKLRCLWATVRSIPDIALWKLRVKTNSEAKQSLFSRFYKGMDFEKLQAKGIEFVPKLESLLRTDMYDRMKQHMADGDRVVIVSASMRFWIEPWAKKEGVDLVISTEPEIDCNGNMTGRFSTPNCNGAEKVKRLSEAIPGLEKYHITAYGDSSGDKDIMRLADRKIWV